MFGTEIDSDHESWSIFASPLRTNTFSRKPIWAQQSSGPASAEDSEEGKEASAHEVDARPSIEKVRFINPHAGKHRSLKYKYIDMLVTLLHKCILDRDWTRAQRCYSVLLRCKNVEIRLCYEQGLDILNHTDPTGARSAEFLTRLINKFPPNKPRENKRVFDRADTFVPLLARLRIKHRQFEIGMQELDAWLLIPPYMDDRQLWNYQATCCENLADDARRRNDQREHDRLKRKQELAVAKASGLDDEGSDTD